MWRVLDAVYNGNNLTNGKNDLITLIIHIKQKWLLEYDELGWVVEHQMIWTQGKIFN